MTAAEVLPELGKKLSKKSIVTLRRKFRKSGASLDELIALTLSPEPKTAWRSAWLLENVVIGKMGTYLAEVPKIVDAFPKVENAGARRHYAKIMARITDPGSKILHDIVAKKDMENVAEACFDWLIDERVRVAVESFCIEILFNLRHRYDWVLEELPAQVVHVMDRGSAGIQSKGRKILSALRYSPFT